MPQLLFKFLQGLNSLGGNRGSPVVEGPTKVTCSCHWSPGGDGCICPAGLRCTRISALLCGNRQIQFNYKMHFCNGVCEDGVWFPGTSWVVGFPISDSHVIFRCKKLPLLIQSATIDLTFTVPVFVWGFFFYSFPLQRVQDLSEQRVDVPSSLQSVSITALSWLSSGTSYGFYF